MNTMGSFLQTKEWANFKAKYGWQAYHIGETIFLARKIILGQSLWYAPELDYTDGEVVSDLLTQAKEMAAKKSVFLIRLEFANAYDDELTERLKGCGLVKSFETVQPEWRAVVDIRPSEGQIMARMHPKGRYNIRVATRHKVKAGESKDVESFYRLYVTTARREGFEPRPLNYISDLLSSIPWATLFIATYRGAALAAAIVVFYEETATYLYGASSSQERQLMAPYLLHWEIMLKSKENGCLSYDLGEISPKDAVDHPLSGLTDFKVKFGAEGVHLLGSWDYVCHPHWYRLFRIGEKLRRGFRA
jgi:lipid II:glycine glycyltransferase (peptidoglycan interpeptide bridge formation enzyme)